MKYHINKNGKVGICTAESGMCPYGEVAHFSNSFEAQQAFNEAISKHVHNEENYSELDLEILSGLDVEVTGNVLRAAVAYDNERMLLKALKSPKLDEGSFNFINNRTSKKSVLLACDDSQFSSITSRQGDYKKAALKYAKLKSVIISDALNFWEIDHMKLGYTKSEYIANRRALISAHIAHKNSNIQDILAFYKYADEDFLVIIEAAHKSGKLSNAKTVSALADFDRLTTLKYMTANDL